MRQKKRLKKALSLLLAAAMILSVNMTTFAEEPEAPDPNTSSDESVPSGSETPDTDIEEPKSDSGDETLQNTLPDIMPVTETTCVATVNGTSCASLADVLTAVQAAAGDSQPVTVVLQQDIHLNATIKIEKGMDVILDLNGKHVTVAKDESTGRSLYAVDNYGTFTLMDSAGDGSITARGIENLGDGVMTINGGKIVSCDSNGGAAIWNEADLTVNGGTFETVYVGSPGDSTGIGCLNNQGRAVITGGTFHDVNRRTYAIISTGEIEITPAEGREVTVHGAHGGLGIDSGTAVVNGGSYSSDDYYGLYVSNDGLGEDPTKAVVTVNGGTFSGKKYSVWIGSDYNNPVNSTIVITNGTFENPLNAQECTREGAIQISGGTFSEKVPDAYLADGYCITQDASGTYTAQEIPSISTAEELKAAFRNGGTYKLAGDITLDDANSGNGILNAKKDIVLDLGGHTITASKAQCVFGTSSAEPVSITLRNGTVTAVSDDSSNSPNPFYDMVIQRTQGDSFTAENVVFHSAASALVVNKKGGNVTLTDCTVNGAVGTLVRREASASTTGIVTINGITVGASVKNFISPQLTDDSVQNIHRIADLSADITVRDGETVTIASTTGTEDAPVDIMVMSGGTLILEDGASVGQITVREGGTFTMNGGSATKVYTSGTTRINGGTVETGTAEAITVAAGTFTIYDGKVTSTYGNALTFAEGYTGTGVIYGGTFTGKTYGLVVRKYGEGGSVTVEGGICKGSTAGNAIINKNETPLIGEGYLCVSDPAACTQTVGLPVAEADGKQYLSVGSAISAIAGTGTVKLLTNASESVTIPKGIHVTLDLNGKTLTNTDSHTIYNQGTLTITDTSSSTGTIDNITHAKAAIYNETGADLTLLAGNITRSQEAGIDGDNNGGNSYYVILNHGTMTIGQEGTSNNITVKADGKYSSLIENGWQNGKTEGADTSTMTIWGGVFTGGINTVKNDDRGVLTIHGGTFQNHAQYCVMNWNKTEILDGTFNSTAKSAVYNGYDSEIAVGDLTIAGGDFTFNPNYFAIYRWTDKGEGSVSVSGGTFFSQNICNGKASEYCADGFAPAKVDGSDKYTVAKAVVIDYVGASLSYKATDTEKANMRFSYKMTLPSDWDTKQVTWSWTWGTSVENGAISNGKKVIGSKKEDITGTNAFTSNLVINNIPINGNYDTQIYAQLTATYNNETIISKAVASQTFQDIVRNSSIKDVVDAILKAPGDFGSAYDYEGYARELKNRYDSEGSDSLE